MDGQWKPSDDNFLPTSGELAELEDPKQLQRCSDNSLFFCLIL